MLPEGRVRPTDRAASLTRRSSSSLLTHATKNKDATCAPEHTGEIRGFARRRRQQQPKAKGQRGDCLVVNQSRVDPKPPSPRNKKPSGDVTLWWGVPCDDAVRGMRSVSCARSRRQHSHAIASWLQAIAANYLNSG